MSSLRSLLPLLLVASFAAAQEARNEFKQNCMSCHTIGGGRLTGPDLKGLAERRDRAWVVRFILDPSGVLDSGDSYAARLLEESRGVRMPNIAG
ncbi:MAG: cytochrome c [Planctomycetes bacterium]|nr:cytochrome c [Planctomycetota bacterium]